MKLSFWLKTAGYCLAKEHHAKRTGRRMDIQFPATYGLIKHPDRGYILFDTGYSHRFYEETQSFPGSIYGRMTPTFITEKEEAVYELRSLGIAPEEVRHIIISHFHADHVAGLKDFPRANFYCSSIAFEQAMCFKGLAAVRRGLLPGLLPEDMRARTTLLDPESFSTQTDPDLGLMIDLFGDGLILLASLPGHAAGQIGALLDTNQGKVLLVADACWLTENYQNDLLPSPIVKLFFHSWKDFRQSLQKVKNYWQRNPETLIIPTHCESTRQKIMQQQKPAS